MAHDNKFSKFAAANGANIKTPDEWTADPVRQLGFQSGIAPSVQFNTSIFQPSVLTKMMTDFIAENGTGDGSDVVPDGSDAGIATLKAQFIAALNAAISFVGPAATALIHYGMLQEIGGDRNNLLGVDIVPPVATRAAGLVYVMYVGSRTNTEAVAFTPSGASPVAASQVYRNNGNGLAIAGDFVNGGFVVLIDHGYLANKFTSLNPLPSDVNLLIKNYTTNNYARGALIARRVWSTANAPGVAYVPTLHPADGVTKIVRRVRVTVVGAGGAGGGATVQGMSGTGLGIGVGTGSGCFAAASGGGAGGFAISELEYADPDALWAALHGTTIYVGAGGVGNVGSNGGNGQNSGFGAFLSATGGPGGSFNGNGDVNYPNVQGSFTPGYGIGGNVVNGHGGQGMFGIAMTGHNMIAGNGGYSSLGSGGVGYFSRNAHGVAAPSNGAGGSGALSRWFSTPGWPAVPDSDVDNTPPPYAGGNGGDGYIMIEEYS